MLSDANALELLELYMDLVEKQDEIIFRLSQIVKKQSTEIQHMKNSDEFIVFEKNLDIPIADEVMEEYREMKGEEP